MVSNTSFNEGRRSGLMLSGPTDSHRAAPTWLESLLFLALMSGPPQFSGDRDAAASLAGQIDSLVLLRIAVWACAGLWVLARLYASVLRRGILPPVNPVQMTGVLLIAALSLSLPESPGVLLTAFTLGQYAVMLSFAWLFVHRFGASAYLQHLFIGASVLALMIVAAVFIAPDLVIKGTRLRGDGITDTGTVAVIGLIFCLSNVPALKSRIFWGMTSLFGVLLISSQTRVAYGGLLAYLAIGFAYGKGLRVRTLVPLLAVLSVALLMLDVLSNATGYIIRDRASLETMSDRIPLWQYLTAVVMQKAPLTGLGYYAASRVWAPEYNDSLGNAHSAFFEILLGGGLISAAVYLGLCALLLWYAVRLLGAAGSRPEVIVAAALLVVTLLFGITSVAVHVGPSGFTFWSLTALLPALWRQHARKPVSGHQRLPVRTMRSRAQTAADFGSVRL
jgi:O-antigen ligase